MDMNIIAKIAKTLMIDRKAHIEREIGGVYYHGQRTANIAITLRKNIFSNDSNFDETLIAAAYLHDCGKGIGPHAEYGAVIAKHALKNIIDQEEIDKIANLILLHTSRNPENNDFDKATKLLQDADLLDHIGIYEIWMNIQYYAHTEGSISDMITYYDKNYKNQRVKHRKLLNFDYSRRVYDEKAAFEKSFIDRLNKEGQGELVLED